MGVNGKQAAPDEKKADGKGMPNVTLVKLGQENGSDSLSGIEAIFLGP